MPTNIFHSETIAKEKLTERLNQLGADGWEFREAHPEGIEYRVFMSQVFAYTDKDKELAVAQAELEAIKSVSSSRAAMEGLGLDKILGKAFSGIDRMDKALAEGYGPH